MASKISITSSLLLPSSSDKIPQIGLGVYRSDASVCEKTVLAGLKAGYRHIDSAQFYANEAQCGTALAQVIKSGRIQSRSNVFLTTKILAGTGSVEKSLDKCRKSVEKMDPEGAAGKGYVDLFLIHSPNAGKAVRKELWLALEGLKKEGRAREIGVSNYGRGHIEEMKEYATVWPPAVNQIELHPWCQQKEAVAYCQSQGIVVEAYCPVVRMNRAHDETLVSIAKKHSKEGTQVLIRWSLQKGFVPLPKSDDPGRIAQNIDLYDFELDSDDMERLDALDEGEEGAIVQAVTNHV